MVALLLKYTKTSFVYSVDTRHYLVYRSWTANLLKPNAVNDGNVNTSAKLLGNKREVWSRRRFLVVFYAIINIVSKFY